MIMGGVEPIGHRDGELKERSPEYLRTKDSEEAAQTSKDLTQGGNLDSGYHSFSCTSNCCNHSCPNRSPDMITTTMGHEEDFPPPRVNTRNSFNNGQPQTSPELGSECRNDVIAGCPVRTDKTGNSNVLDRGCNSLPDVSSLKHNHTVPPSSDSNNSNNSKNREHAVNELAEKIAFFYKLGYTEIQVRKILYKIGPNASKNDILMALGDYTASSLPTMTISENNSLCNEAKPGDLIGRGVSTFELISRGPSTVEDDTKEDEASGSDNLRPIVIDGSNIAMSHGNKEYFSCKGIQIAVQYFLDRGHRDITVFVPKYRKEQTRPDAPIKDQEILKRLEEEKILVWTPSRQVGGRRITCYDDRFILTLAQETDGIIVSNDNFRDLQNERATWKEVVEKRLLMYSFVNDRFMPPDDPLGRNGPSLENFLRIRLSSDEKRKQECPYGKKCTYGKKCKYFHPECSFSQRSVSEQLKDETKRRPPPSSAAKSLASEVMKDPNLGQSSSQNGAQSLKNMKKETQTEEVRQKKRDTDAATNRHANHDDLRQTVSPHSSGACGTTLGAATVTHGSVGQDGFPPNMASMQSEFSTVKISQPYADYPQSGGPYIAYPYSDKNSHSAGADAQSSNQQPMGLPHIQLVPPGLHSQAGRNVASSTSPHQHHYPHLQMPHSSPPAISMCNQPGYMGHRHPPNQSHSHQMFQNLTYPSLARQQFQQYPPQQQYPHGYKPQAGHNDMAMYHRTMMTHHMYMSQTMAQDPHLLFPQPNGPLPQIPQGYPYMYPTNQHPMLAPNTIATTSNLTAPHHAQLDQAVYEQANRQVYSSPNPVNPLHAMPRQPQSQPHGYKMAPMHQGADSSTEFKEPSNPRFYLYRNLCALFSRATVDKVLLANPQELDTRKLAKMCLEYDN